MPADATKQIQTSNSMSSEKSATKNENDGFQMQMGRLINGHHTEFLLHPFHNRWFVVITQYGKLANLFTVQFDVRQEHAERRSAVNNAEFHQSIPVTMTCNFGVDRDEDRAAIQFLVNKSKLNKCPQEFVISLGIKDISAKTLREIVEVLNDIIV